MARFLLHENTKESVIRLYEKGKAETGEEAYNNRQPYVVEFIVDWLTPEVIYVSCLMSRVGLTREDLEQIKEYARARGVKQIWQEVGGRLKVDCLE